MSNFYTNRYNKIICQRFSWSHFKLQLSVYLFKLLHRVKRNDYFFVSKMIIQLCTPKNDIEIQTQPAE